MGKTKKLPISWSQNNVIGFFGHSDLLDRMTLRPIMHVAPNWELTPSDDNLLYEEEEDSLAAHLNILIHRIAKTDPPTDYHALENKIASEYEDARNARYYIKNRLWYDRNTDDPIKKDDVGHMMEQASCGSDDVAELVEAAAGRVAIAMHHGISKFDDLDQGHMEMLAIVMMTVLFRRSDTPVR